MSSRSTGAVRLSPQERARRAEAERRRREEEERRRQEAARRQAHDLVALADELRRQAAAASTAGLVRDAAPPPTAKAPAANHAQQTAAKREQMLGIMGAMRAAMEHLPAEVARARRTRLARVRAELQEIEACRDSNFTMHEPRLKALRDDFRRAIADPAEVIERCLEAIVALKSLRAGIDERQSRSPAAEVAACDRIRKRIDDLLAAGELDRFDVDLKPLLRDGEALVARIDAANDSAAEARHLRAAIAATLADLGYEAVELPSDLARNGDDLVYRSPADGLVRFHLARDLTFDAEFVHVASDGPELDAAEFAAATRNCRRWCEDAQRLRDRLAATGVSLEFASALPPERGGFAVVAAERTRRGKSKRKPQAIVEADRDLEQEDECR